MGHAELVSLLISKYFVNLISVLVAFNSSSTSEISELYLDAVQVSLQNLTQQGHTIGIHWIDTASLENQTDFNEMLLEHSDIGIEGYITVLSSLVEFLDARLYATENCILRLKDKYYLFLSDGKDEDPRDVLSNRILKRKLFEMKKENEAIREQLCTLILNTTNIFRVPIFIVYPHHLFVSTERNSAELSLWTQKFVGSSDNFKPIHLDTYLEDGTFEKNTELYPNKIHNMLGRVIEVASITYIPYVISHTVPEGTGMFDHIDPSQPKKSLIYTGTEADILVTFCQLRNCVLRVIPYGNDFWGGIYENGSSDGMIGSVYRHETEFGIGCAYSWFNDIFDLSYSVAKSAVLILGPAPSLYPAYMAMILPFNKIIWSLVILSIFLSAILMHGVMYFNFFMEHRNDETMPPFDHAASLELTQFQMVAIFFQQSFSQSKLDRFAARFFLSTLLLAGLTLENTYSGQLKSLLTIPALTEPVDTIRKFAATNWKWAAPSMAWIYSIIFSDIPHEKRMTDRFIALSHEEQKDASYTGDLGFGVERLHGGTYSFGDYIRDGNLENLIMIKDDLYYDYTRGFAIRGWPMMNSFNTHILWCLEHGLYNYWEKKHVYYYLDKETQGIMYDMASGHLQKYPPIPLTIANISGPLWALVIGYGLALIVLVAEICVNRRRKLVLSTKIKV